MTLGDSKTAYGGWQPILTANLNTLGNRSWQAVNDGRGGTTAATYAAQVDSVLAATDPSIYPAVALINLGTNDAPSMPTQASFEANMGYIGDAIHTKWPYALVYYTTPYRDGYAAACDTLAGWISNVVATRTPWAALGDDERVWLAPNNALYTYDGLHYNATGDAAKAAAAQTAMGY